MSPQVCAHILPGGISPFVIIMFGWQDGLTEGFARCSICAQSYHFSMLSWDTEQDERVFGFWRISEEAYDRIAALDASCKVGASNLEVANLMNDAARNALATVFEVEFLLLSDNLSRNITAISSPSFSQWSAFLRG